MGRFITLGRSVARALTDDFRFQLKHKFASLRGIHGFAKRRSKLTPSRNSPSVLLRGKRGMAVGGKIGRARVQAKRWKRKGGCVGREVPVREKRREEKRERIQREGDERINLFRC